MWKLYSYDQLKGKIKVGDRVRAARGRDNFCKELNEDGSNEQKITEVADEYFAINKCSHSYTLSNKFLELFVSEFSWDCLEAGMVVVEKGGNKLKVLEVGSASNAFLVSYANDFSSAHRWFTKEEAQKWGWIIEVSTPEPEWELCDGFDTHALETCSAFTCAELGMLLPIGYSTQRNLTPSGNKNDFYWAGRHKYTASWNKWARVGIKESTEADARAKMLIYLIENKLINPAV